MTQSIVIQVGQCGNQVGCRFWDFALREHTLLKDDSTNNTSMWNFFRRSQKSPDDLRARAVMVDMEEGVINSVLRTPLGNMFSSHQFVTDVSGSGNNWAVGFHEYGSKYGSEIMEKVRREAELCDCLQGFFLLHSLGGGTGSGLGTAVLEMLSEEFPGVFRFDIPVFPSATDDVITSPYNTVFALEKITEFADCSCPVENEALMNVCNRILKMGLKTKTTLASSKDSILCQKARPFDQMNNIVANLLLNLTSSARFSGSLNVDLNDICTNLVPYPRLHFFVSSVTPLYSLLDVDLPPRKLDQMFTDAFSGQQQLVQCDVKRGVQLACALLARGSVGISDMRRNLDRHTCTTFFKWIRWRTATSLTDFPVSRASPPNTRQWRTLTSASSPSRD
ncbi:tubulin epsilon chain isoform X2 [Ixodes scapularis]|uniref:tubulin epsilon chain isoform X2 n=1 Tax=Ixodes scapularis TaxID=6945 RepID=UPI001A9EB0C5|nr:tubulin epsilon chain isoform X2 [Ixodes scapularis]